VPKKVRKIFKKKRSKSIDLDEIFLDSSNIPAYDKDQFEGRIEQPISKFSIITVGVLFLLMIVGFSVKAAQLQIKDGSKYKEVSENNSLRHDILFAHRGVVSDRNGENLAWNEFKPGEELPRRAFIDLPGFSNLLGFIKYPKKDKSGFYYSLMTTGQDGIEKYFDKDLAGVNGVKLTEVDVKGKVHSESDVVMPQNGKELTLSIDAKLQEKMSRLIEYAATQSGFKGGAGVIMNAKTGEVLAITSYPEYSSTVMTEGKDEDAISGYFQNKNNPFLDRAVSGLFVPGSIVKPYMALAALTEKVVTPETQILSTGSISIPNPYDSTKSTVFKDWKAHGYVDIRKALAVSSDVYFYEVGGGYKGQKGIGIAKIDEYLHKFLLGEKTTGFFDGPAGNIPTPEWKKKTFDEDWFLGNTYHTAIGQYGFQVTPLQMARALTGITNKGTIVSPTILKDEVGEKTKINGIEPDTYQIVKEGMRDSATFGTAMALNVGGFTLGGKTGTAEVGTVKGHVNSWVEGFFPYEDPQYVFAIVLENGPNAYTVGSPATMSSLLRWMKENTPEYLGMAPLPKTANTSN
jgi:penicillin-binding protein 2